MNTIYKYKLDTTEAQIIHLPEGAKIISAGIQNGNIYLWAIVNPENNVKQRVIEIYGTGHPFPDDTGLSSRKHISTIQLNGFVWHIFEPIHAEMFVS